MGDTKSRSVDGRGEVCGGTPAPDSVSVSLALSQKKISDNNDDDADDDDDASKYRCCAYRA